MAKSLVFVDRRVSDYRKLLSSLAADSEIFLLDPDRDGLTQMVDYLSGYSDLDSIQIISHGSSGALYLGSTTLSNDNLFDYRDALGRVGQALIENGDILLYGCNVAQGDTGRDFIAQLAELTGAEVAASTNPTGASNQGGDWALEATTGTIETAGLYAPDYHELLGLTITPLPRSYPGHTSGEYCNNSAFAALRADGSVVTWGDAAYGGNSSAVAASLDGTNDVTQIFSTSGAFAALLANGSVVTWGDPYYDAGDSSSVEWPLNGSIDVTRVFSTSRAFAALRADGSVVTWGQGSGGDSHAVEEALDGSIDVTQIFSTYGGFAALRANGSVATWGDPYYGGDSSTVVASLDGSIDVTQVFSTSSAFAALRADGSVVTWGADSSGGDSSTVAAMLDGSIDVTQVFSTPEAFAALRADGSVVTWGGAGGDSCSMATALNGSNDVVTICSNEYAFAALRADGSVVTWGWGSYGGDSSFVAEELNGSIDVTQIFSTYGAFAALRTDGSVVSWGNISYGGCSSAVAAALNGSIDVVQIFSTYGAFAALRADGSVVAWGDISSGGDSRAVALTPNGSVGVTQVFSNGGAFAALRADGTLVTWGGSDTGGDSSTVANQLTNVVSMANPYTNDIYLVVPDITPPVLAGFSPADEAIGIAIGSDIVITFDEFIQRGTGNILLKTDAGATVATYNAASSSNLTVSGNNLTINPSANLAYSTSYQVEFTAGTIKDLAGNSFAGTTSYNFTTTAPDTTPPTVTGFSPADEAIGIAVSNNIVVTFSEAIQSGTGNIVLKTGAGVPVATYNAAGSSNLSISGNTLTINPTADLAHNTGYQVEFAAGTIKDLTGNSYVGTTNYSFTTAEPEYNELLGLTITPLPISYPGKSSGEFRNDFAFAALRADGSVVTWGVSNGGGDSSSVTAALNGNIDVTQVFSDEYAFAALRVDGSVVTWGYATYGGDSSSVAAALNGSIDVTQVFSTSSAFAALRTDGSVVTWGRASYGGNSSSVAAALDGTLDVTKVFSTGGAFAALRIDGSVVTWGVPYGGDSSSVATALNGSVDVTQVFSTNYAFAALRADGSVVSWGSPYAGGDSSYVSAALNGTIGVTQIFSTQSAFAALRADGSVVTWGEYGGDSRSVAWALNGTIDVTQIVSTDSAFAALQADGSIVCWGDASHGGDRSFISFNGSFEAKQLFSTRSAFAALLADGSVVTWGEAGEGGDSSSVTAALNGSIAVTQVFSSGGAFAALRADGSVVTWGIASFGGDSSSVAAALDGTIDVTQVFSSWQSFTALRADGSVVSWGEAALGGDSSSVASQLTNVVSMANPYTDDVYLAPETTPPTVTSFSPADEATGVAVGSNIVVTLSEAIQRGTGNIVLKTAAGTTVASYDAASSTNLSISGNILTIDPDDDFVSSTGYVVEFAAGTIKDLAGNSYAGTTTYNFTAADIIAPPAPTINTVATDDVINASEQTNVISGSNEAGATVALNIGGNSRAATVSGTSWSYTLVAADVTAMGQGAETLSATQTDAAGNTSAAGNRSITVDTIAPAAPMINAVATDDIINAAETTSVITGTNETGATVALSIGGNNRDATFNDATWSYTLTAADITAMGQGTETISATQTDAAGNTSVAGTRAITMDTIAPAAPTINAVASDDIINAAETTSVITGTNETGATVALSICGNNRAATISGSSWNYALIAADITAMGQGAESIGTTQTDEAGNTSTATTRAISVDTVAPTVAGFSPADEATGVAVGSNTIMTFSEPVQLGTGNILLKTAAGTTVASYDVATSSNLVITGNTLTIDPSDDFALGTGYSVEFGAGTIKDLAGNSYAGTNSYNFTTAAPDTTPPMIISPADEIIAIGSNIDITFSEAIQPGIGNIVLKTAAGSTLTTYDVASSSNLSISGNTLTINPPDSLSHSTAYQVEFGVGAINDLTGNSFDGTTSYNFITDAPGYNDLPGLTVTPLVYSYPGKSSGEFRNYSAFAALRADGSVVTWGDASYGGDSSSVLAALNGTIAVTQVFSTKSAFAALRADGSVVTWGDAGWGGDSSSVAAALNGTIDVIQVFSGRDSFAALRADGSLVTWGNPVGGNSSYIATALDGTIDVTNVFSAWNAFAALRADGSLVTWGNAVGGNSSSVAAALTGAIDVTQVSSTSPDVLKNAFAALRADGSVVTWGAAYYGGNSSSVAAALDGTIHVSQVFSNIGAFAALRADGSVVTWGYASYGGDSSSMAQALNGTVDVTHVVSTYSAFAALQADGSVVTWGNALDGGGRSFISSEGSFEAKQLFSTSNSFAALLADGSVVTWGEPEPYHDINSYVTTVDGSIDVTQVFSNLDAFAVLLADGSVVTWGDASSGGDSSSVAAALDGGIDVIQVFSTDYAFAALRADGTVVTWGQASTGGNSSAVTGQLTNVVSMANPYTNDVYFALETTPPTVTSFSPADEATGVAAGSNIVVTFSEVIQLGTGNIVLKTAAGTTVSSYDVTGSSNLSISGNTLTIDPADDFVSSTGYAVEFAAGTINDLAGNSYAGTTTYNFTAADIIAPPAPTINTVATDDVINATEQGSVITGSNEARATVALSIDGNSRAATVSGTSWSYTLVVADLTAMGQGTETLSATQTDAAGNISNAGTRAITVDTITPTAPTINAVTTDDIISAAETASTITGSNEAGATVALSIGGNNRAVTVSGTSWSYNLVAADLTAMGQGAETLSATQTDAAGNTSSAGTHAITVDTIAPTAPTFNTVAGDDLINTDEQSTVITGSNEAGATVALSIGGNSRAATVSGTTWSYTLVADDLTAMGQGAETISATQTDAARNTSPAGTRNITVDTIAPSAPTVNTVATDNTVNASEQTSTITGSNEAGATVALNIGGNSRVAVVNGTTWSYTLVAADLTAMGQGAETISTTQTDVAGNISTAGSHSITVDTISPDTPTINIVASDDLINATEQGSVITGANEAWATVALNIAGNSRAATVIGTTWNYTLLAADLTAMGQGTETISLTQTDAAGNTSNAGTRAITVDTVVPSAPIINAFATDNVINVSEQTSTITGSNEAGATVALNIGGNSRAATVSDTTWNYTLLAADLTAMGQGAETISATQTDAAGNTSAVGTRAITVDTIAPSAPTINAVASDDLINASEQTSTITGNNEAGATVALSIGGNSRAATVSGTTWSYAMVAADLTAMGQGSETLSAIQTDAAGNTSSAGTHAITVDTIAPTASFSPSDEATGVAVGGDIVATFSEAIQRGSGNVLLKTTAGTTVATYDAATSTNLSISGNTLTINPSADLASGTGYTVEFAAGTVQDLAANNYGGSMTYNFTTAAPLDTTAPVAPKLVTNAAFNFLVDPQVTMQTSMGTVVLELNPERAPITVANMLAYADSGFYDNTLFHRVIPGFMVQGGGFTSGLTYKTPTYNPIVLESNNGLSNLRGTIAMARTSVANSASSQFFINQVDNTYLNYSSASSPGYAVFGKVVSGLAVIDSIAQVPTTTVSPYANVPVTEVTITSLQQTLAGSSITNLATLTVSDLESGATWAYSLDDGVTWTTGLGNSFAVPVGSYAAGAIEVRQSDVAGNLSDSGALPSALVVETTAPTVTGFSPADEASGVTIDSNLVITLSEPIQRGSGIITLKTAGGVTVATYNAASSTNLSISGNTLTIDPTAELLPASAYQVEIAAGAIKDLAGNSYGGTTAYNFTTAIYTSYPGTPGNDTFTGGVNNDLMNGGAGLDNAIFSGNRQSYTITATGSGCSLAGEGWGADTLTSIERLHFADVNLAWDIDGSAGQVYRLYQAAFDRTPDLGGLGGWIGGMDGGMTLLQVAAAFVGSGEFQSLYGANPSNEQFITQLYLNVLNRAPDEGGFGYWVDQLARSLQSRAEVLVFFSESGENQAAVLPAIAGGILYASAEQAAGPARGQNFEGSILVDILIGTVGNDTFFGGAGDDRFDGGVGIDSAIYEGSRTGHTITRTSGGLTVSGSSDGTDTLVNVERLKFADSALAFDIDGNAGQTYRLYQAAFARTPDTAGLSDWIRGMDSGMTLQNVATGFIGSGEFKSLYGADPTNTEFIDLLYNNVLHRAADQAGYDYWIDQINHGMSREQVLVGFSESQENQLALLGVIQDGIEYIPA